MMEQLQSHTITEVEKLWILNVGDLKPMEYSDHALHGYGMESQAIQRL